jgi:ATP-binding cassette subfamily F protein 3
VLEQALEEFAGTVVVVSHDRYFLDRVVDRVFEIRDGELHVYEGGYSYYAEQRARASQPAPMEMTRAPVKNPDPRSGRPLGTKKRE